MNEMLPTEDECVFPTPGILYQDDVLVVVSKPSGLAVHPSEMVHDRITALSLVRDAVGCFVHPAHRLDRGTSGVLVFAKDRETCSKLMQGFASREHRKSYLCVVRGWAADSGRRDVPLKHSNGKDLQEAATAWTTLARSEIEGPCGNYPTARYSLLHVLPETGRFHQIRRHMRDENHPLIGDTQEGDNKQNRFFREKTGTSRLMLHALSLDFPHPLDGRILSIQAPVPEDFLAPFKLLGWDQLELPKD
ncbi:MAG: hypothetical protein RL095_3460 [Verrucomicrobiota bacterium]|jgi:tRNA pseudouridine65 synthase